MRDFRELKVWEKAHRFVLDAYKATRAFPSDELYGLTSQLRRCSVSIPSNLAEGCGRRTDKDLAHFCDIASGSASEAEYQLILARDLNYIEHEDHRELENQIAEVRRMLNSFTAAIRRRIKENAMPNPKT